MLLPIIPPSHAGSTAVFTAVQERTYTWQATIDNATFQTFYDDFNLSTETSMFLSSPITKDDISLMSEAGLSANATVYNITADYELMGMINVSFIQFVINYSAGGQNFEALYMNYSARDNTTFSDFYWIMNQTFQLSSLFPFFNPTTISPTMIWTTPILPFIATNINWTAAILVMNSTLQMYVSAFSYLSMDDYTLSLSGNGFTVAYNVGFLNASYTGYTINQSKPIEYTIEYDSNGILSKIELIYGGTGAIKWEQGTGDPPPPPPSPHAPVITNPSPNSGASGVSVNASLKVDISDADGDDVVVNFYDQSNNLIGTDTVTDGSGSASVVWRELDYNKTYYWYVNASDGKETTKSAIWAFSTGPEPPNSIPFGEFYIVSMIVGISVLLIAMRKKVKRND